MLDGEIGNAAPRIELVGRRKRRRGADVEAGAASAAMVVLGSVHRQVEACENRAQEQPRTELARNEISMLTLPAEACGFGERLFHDRRRVDKDFDLTTGVVDEPAPKFLEPRLDHLVIIVAARVYGDGTLHPLLEHRERIFVRPVVDAQHDD